MKGQLIKNLLTKNQRQALAYPCFFKERSQKTPSRNIQKKKVGEPI